MSRYIDVGKQLVRLYRMGLSCEDVVKQFLLTAPAADVVKVVRCKDCKYGDTGTDEIGRQFYKCIGIHYGGVSPTDYCSYGERKDG